MSTPALVHDFYQRLWMDGDLDAASELLATDFRFRGSLGNVVRGQQAFKDYLVPIRCALAGYRCEILACVAEGNQAFAQMRFSGQHVGMFRGYAPTGKSVDWLGAALFRFEGGVIAELWVLGDLAGLDALLFANQRSE
jgi:predicted ester cyclase